MRGGRAGRVSACARRSILAVVAAVVTAGAGAGRLSAAATAAPPACTDNFTGPSGGDWGTAANWTKVSDSSNAVPTATDVACSSLPVTVSETGDTADSIQFTAPASLTITSGYLTLTSA